MSRRRAVAPPEPLPEVYTPPFLPTGTEPPHPEKTKRTSRKLERRDVMLPGIDDGPRYLLYGEQRTGGKLQFAHYDKPTDALWCVVELAAGECNALLDVKYADGRTPVAAGPAHRWQYWWYPGTAAGEVCASMAAAVPGWNEAFAGTCNVVFVLRKFGSYWKATIPDFVWRFEAKKCLLPEGGAPVYSTNVWNQWHDYVRHAEGKALPASRVDSASFLAARTADATNGIKCVSHFGLLDSTDPDSVIETFRLMARGWWFWDANQFRVVADRAGSPVATYDDDDVSEQADTDFGRSDPVERPNKTTIWYTDVANNWQLKAYSYPETDPVGVDVIEEEFRLPHLHDPAQVKELAFYLHNSRVFDATIRERWLASTAGRELGDIVTRTFEEHGLTMQARLLNRTKNADGTFEVELVQHDNAKFAAFALTDSPKIASTLPDPGELPPDVNTSTVVWNVELFDVGPNELPRGVLSFTMPEFAYLQEVEVWLAISGGPSRFWFATTSVPVVTPVLWESGTYQLTFRSRQSITQELTAGSVFSVAVTGANDLPAGAPAKAITLISDRQIITFDETGALSPATQPTAFSVHKQNTTATVNWSATRADGVAITPITNLLSSATGDSVTMAAAAFNAQRGATEGVIVTATVTDGATITDKISVLKVQRGPQGPGGAAGVNGIGYRLTNEAHAVPSNADGSSPVLTGANGSVKVFSGGTEVAAGGFTIAAGTATGCTGSVDNVAKTYTVTAMSADTATFIINVTYGSTTVPLAFSLTKSRQGTAGTNGANAKTVTLLSDRQIITYDETGVSPATQPTVFSVNKQNTTATVSWSATDASGAAITPVTNLLSAATGDSVTMSAAAFNTYRGATEGVIVTATLTDGTTISDRLSVVRVQKGATGNNAKTLTVSSDRQQITYDELGNVSPLDATQIISLTARKQNTTALVTWKLYRLDGVEVTPTSSYLTAVNGDTTTLGPNNFNIARGATNGVIIEASLTDGATTLTDNISVVKVQKGATGAAGPTGPTGPAGPQGDPADEVIAVKDSMAGIGGRLLAAPTTKLAADLSAVATSISVDAAVLTNGGIAVLQKVVGGVQQTEYLTVTSVATGTGPYTYTVTRNADGSGADAWLAGDTVVSLGVTGSPFIDIYSARGLKSSSEVGPSIVGNVKTGAAWHAWEPRWAIGNLNGLYGYAADTFGAAFGVPSGAWLKIDATNGIRIGHNATTKISLSAAGNASFSGSITADSGTIGGWTIGATSLSGGNLTLHNSGRISIASGSASYGNSGTSLWADSTGRFSLSNKLLFDGTTLELTAGNVSIVGGGVVVDGTGASTGWSYTFRSSGGSNQGGLYLGGVGLIELKSPNGDVYISGDDTKLEMTSTGVYLYRSAGAGTRYFRGDGFTTDAGDPGNGTINATYAYKVGGTQVISTRGAAVANATNATDVITQLNTLLARLRVHGLIAS